MLNASRLPVSLQQRPGRRTLVTRCSAQETPAPKSYFVAMNVFKVKPESYSDFEEVWKSRESRLKQMPGFVRFAMLRCENVTGKYISQTYWESKEAFQAWTRSSQFAASHGTSGSSGGGGQGGQGHQGGGSQRANMATMLEAPPSPEYFETVTITE